MKIVAITSCATGIAHTFMAAEAIEKVCKAEGFKVKVETQGAMGIENKLSRSDIEEADYIVFANDVGISKSERFEGYEDKILKFQPHEVVKHPEIVITEINNKEK